MKTALLLSGILMCLFSSVSSGNPNAWWDDVALTASEVVPPTDASGSARLLVFLDDPYGWHPGEYTACYEGLQDSVISITICAGGEGENGPVIFTPYVGEFPCNSTATATGWDWDMISAAEVGQLYVLLSTRSHPEGALRGQMHMQDTPVREVTWGSVKTMFR